MTGRGVTSTSTYSPGTLATFAVRFVKNGRHVGGHQDSARDCLSPLAQRHHAFNTTSLGSLNDPSGWNQLVAARGRYSIPDAAAFRIDFARWLKTLAHRDRRIIAAFIRGDGTQEVAGRFGITEGRVSQLRRRYENQWRLFQGEAA